MFDVSDTCTFSNHNFNKEYTGNWKDDLQNGYGRMAFFDPSIYEGTWEEGEMTGYGRATFVNEDKLEYSGSWKDGQPHGHGEMKFKDGEVYIGMWIKGDRHGESVEADDTKWIGQRHNARDTVAVLRRLTCYRCNNVKFLCNYFGTL
jgi:hypothetical protein